MRLFKTVRKLVCTYPILNMADCLRNSWLQKGPALCDHSLPADDLSRQLASFQQSQVLTPEILYPPLILILFSFFTIFTQIKFFSLQHSIKVVITVVSSMLVYTMHQDH